MVKFTKKRGLGGGGRGRRKKKVMTIWDSMRKIGNQKEQRVKFPFLLKFFVKVSVFPQFFHN